MHPDYMHIGEPDDKLIEEMAELTKELCKIKRFGMNETNIELVRSEIADVKHRLYEYEEYLNGL